MRIVPEYGHRSLADVMPSVLAALDRGGAAPRVLPIPATDCLAVLLIDGLGAELLAAHRDDAPCLGELTELGPLSSGFPSSTPIGLASLGTGLAPGAHGILGITFRSPTGHLLDSLQWRDAQARRFTDLRDVAVPEQVQNQPTMFEAAAKSGITVTTVSRPEFADSGLTRAALRGGAYVGSFALGDLAAGVISAIQGTGRRLVYGYHADLDSIGHVYGPGTLPWRLQLRQVDTLVATVVEALPRGGVLVVTGDHGMITRGVTFDADTDERLTHGVELLGGDARARHVYCTPGATVDVVQAWRSVLTEHAWVLTREQAIDEGWFGPVTPRVIDRIGDLVVAMRGDAVVVRSQAEKSVSRLIGQHGSLSAAEQLVPLLLAHNSSGTSGEPLTVPELFGQ